MDIKVIGSTRLSSHKHATQRLCTQTYGVYWSIVQLPVDRTTTPGHGDDENDDDD